MKPSQYEKKFGYTQGYMDLMTPKYSGKCMCSACGLFFKSSAGFDMHRIDDPAGRYGRRCLNTTEMESLGMVRKGTGHWVTKEMDATAVGRAAGKTSPESNGVA